MFTKRRVIANFVPNEVISNNNIGILVVDQAPIKINIYHFFKGIGSNIHSFKSKLLINNSNYH